MNFNMHQSVDKTEYFLNSNLKNFILSKNSVVKAIVNVSLFLYKQVKIFLMIIA